MMKEIAALIIAIILVSWVRRNAYKSGYNAGYSKGEKDALQFKYSFRKAIVNARGDEDGKTKETDS